MRSMGVITLMLAFQGIGLEVEFHVADVPMPVLCGLPIIKAFGMVIDIPRGLVQFRDASMQLISWHRLGSRRSWGGW
jgi:hypothetical protein